MHLTARRIHEMCRILTLPYVSTTSAEFAFRGVNIETGDIHEINAYENTFYK